jgi:hypothetical protein
MAQRLTPDRIEDARRLRAEGFSWNQIGLRLDTTPFRLRTALDEHFRRRRNEMSRRNWARREPDDRCGKPGSGNLRRKTPPIPKQRLRASCDHVVTTFDHVPDEVLREREQHEAALKRRTLTQRLLGDPPEGWRALDQRRQG